MATMKDVALLAEVSIATVSRALTKPELVAKKTREKVNLAVQHSGYDISYLLRAKERRNADTIQVITADFKGNAFKSVIRGIEDSAYEQGFLTIISESYQDYMTHNLLCSITQNKNIAGIIGVGFNPQTIVDFTKNRALPPLVLAGKYYSDNKYPSVYVDMLSATYSVIDNLIIRGHRRIAIIVESNDKDETSFSLLGYEQALKRAGIALNRAYIMRGNATFECGKYLFKKLWSLDLPPTAIFCYADIVALGVMRAAFELKISVPQTVSVVGCGGINAGKYTTPILGTIEQPQYDMGQKATEMLIKMILGQKLQKNSWMCIPKWIEGESIMNIVN